MPQSFNVREKPRTERDLCPMARFSADDEILPLKENWSERWCTLTRSFESAMDSILNLEVRKDDVFVVTYMKCGTTWMQETAWLLMNDLDFDRAKQTGVLKRSIFIDFAGLFQEMSYTIEECNNAPDPRLIKSHMPMNLLPKQIFQKKQKIIYVARNVKDVVVSSFHFITGLGIWSGTIDEYVEDFMNDDILFTPFWAHIVDFWKIRNEPHIFFVTYEEMKRDLSSVLQRLCRFLGRSELTEDELKKTVHHLSFNSMRDNNKTNLTTMLKENLPTNVNDNFEFMRRGIVGSYKDELSAENQKKLNDWSIEFLAKHNIEQEDIFGSL